MWLYTKGDAEAVNLQYVQSILRDNTVGITFYQLENEVYFTFSSEKARDEYFEMIIAKLQDMESKPYRLDNL